MLYSAGGCLHFNPRTRTGTTGLGDACLYLRCISIHVPARGTTSLPGWCATLAIFQSTYPHGERPSAAPTVGLAFNFNPRTRTGYDVRQLLQPVCTIISIHVPARGTTSSRCNGLHISIFQSTYPHGVRHLATPVVRAIHIISIHVPARGTTDGHERDASVYHISIHVPARGTTRLV